jgi:catechol 2,3-dioxygenase-like lactoylglutathione lyase family enzyme
MTTYTQVIPRLAVGDLARSIDFYTRILGFTLDLSWPDDEPTFCIVSQGSVRLGFFVAEGPPAPNHGSQAMLSLEAEGVQELYERLRRSVNVEWGPEVYWYRRREFAIRDVDGYLIIFTEETDDPPTCLDE